MSNNSDEIKNIIAALQEPFDPTLLHWFVGDYNFDVHNSHKLPVGFRTMGQALCSIDSRLIQERLDTVVGPANWCNHVEKAADGSVIQGISILLDGTWVTKSDGVGPHDKWNFTTSFSRAAAMWGIGRYMYLLGVTWQPVIHDGTKWVLAYRPALPDFALPYGVTPEEEGAVALLDMAVVSNESTDHDPNEPYYEDIKEENPAQAPAPQVQATRRTQTTGKSETKITRDDLLERAKAYKVPRDVIMGGSSLGEVLNDPGIGPQVIAYLAGKSPSRAGKYFEAATEEQNQLMNAANYLYSNLVMAGAEK